MRIANGVMLVVFLCCIAVQYNDPDPVSWIFYYGVVAVFCILALRGIYTWVGGVVAVLYFLGAAYYLPGWNIETVLLLQEPKMYSPAVELARESFGLFLCGVWMLVLTFVWWRGRHQEISQDIT